MRLERGARVAVAASGYTINVPRLNLESLPGQSGLQLDADVAVPLTGADFFAGRDPVLARALR